jgi:hypothetical protein
VSGEKLPHMDRNSTEGERAAKRARLIAVGVAVALLSAIVVAVVAFSSSGEDGGVGAAPAECIDSWNADESTLGIGSHVASLHGYTSAWVLRLGEDLERDPDSGGRCTVVFPASQLDPEPEFAATVQEGRSWEPLSGLGASEAELGELQREAMTAANAAVLPDGTLTGQ